jgi:hypothetical protein
MFGSIYDFNLHIDRDEQRIAICCLICEIMNFLLIIDRFDENYGKKHIMAAV